MAEYLLVNDVHLADRPPSSCTDTYLGDLFDLIESILDVATRRAAEAVIFAGDVFHLKTPTRTSHATVMRFIEILADAPCQILIVPGNHDMQHDRIESILESQPLGVVFRSGVAAPLIGIHGLRDGLVRHPVFGVPWLKHFTAATVAEAFTDFDLLTGHRLVVTHAPLYPPGKELPYENYPAADWAAAMGGHGTVHYGHVHEPHGIYTVGGVTFSNPGALSRGSLHEHNLTRPVQIAVWDSDTGHISHQPLPHKPASEVLRAAEAAVAKREQADYATFLDAIGSTSLAVTSIEDVIAAIRALDDLTAEEKTLIVDLLAEAAA